MSIKIKILLLAICTTTFIGCSTVYKSGQTPDDVYYSPARSYVVIASQNREEVVNNNYEERYIRMSIRNPRWRNLDYGYGYDYSYHPYNYGYNYGYYYNPYYYPYPIYNPIIIKPSNPVNSVPRQVNLGGYGNNYNNNNIVPNKQYQSKLGQSNPVYNNKNVKKSNTFPSNNSQPSTSPSNDRIYNPSSGSGNNNSSPSSGSKSNGISRPPRK